MKNTQPKFWLTIYSINNRRNSHHHIRLRRVVSLLIKEGWVAVLFKTQQFIVRCQHLSGNLQLNRHLFIVGKWNYDEVILQEKITTYLQFAFTMASTMSVYANKKIIFSNEWCSTNNIKVNVNKNILFSAKNTYLFDNSIICLQSALARSLHYYASFY